MTRLSTLLTVALVIGLFALAIPAKAVDTVEPGDTIQGELGKGDPQLDDGEYYDEYVIDCEIGTCLTITQSSESVDSYLIVSGPDGRQSENDDYSSSSLDSRVSILIRSRGDYTIMCTSYAQEQGEYTLQVEERQPARFFGIFAGIENYPQDFPDAPLCDDDAEAMYNAFVDSGLMAPDDGILLTNRNAELADVEAAFNTLKTEIGPNDTFLFFFSGHGDQVEEEGSRGDELDGLDEAICLRDGDLTDDDFAGYLDQLNPGLTVVVLDACNSGGLAQDVVDRPGRVLFASSEEDTLSDFAPQLDAGGYLSVFFREAIEGDADLDGDGMIMMGELTRFLLNRFYEEVPEPDSAAYGYQALVHDRGLVTQDTIFCWFDPTTGRIKEKG